MSGKQKLLILGGGRYGKLIEQLAIDSGGYSSIEFFDDFNTGSHIKGKIADAKAMDPNSCEMLIGIGYLHFPIREKLFVELSSKFQFATLVHPSSFVSPQAQLDPGCCVFSNSNIEQGAHLKNNVTIFNNTSITHDVEVGEHSFISVGVNMGGGVIIGDRNFIGVGATLINDFRIGNDVTICAGTCVSADIADGLTMVGNPMKSIDSVELKRTVLRG